MNEMRGSTRLFFVVFLVATGALGQSGASAPWTRSLAYRVDELQPITVGKFGYPYITVSINSHPLALAIDTANMTGLSVSKRVARELQLPQIALSQAVDADGRRLGERRVFRAESVGAFGRVWEGEKVHELGTEEFDGLIGPRFLLGKRFTLDYTNRVIGISESPLPAELPGHEALPLVPVEGLEGMIVVEGFVNGRRVFIQVDTGKSRTCVASALAAELRLPKVKYGYQINEIRLGSLLFRVPSAREERSFAGISQGLPEPILLGIGSDILAQTVFTVDYPGQRFLIQMNQR